jgi:hypothetical protein
MEQPHQELRLSRMLPERGKFSATAGLCHCQFSCPFFFIPRMMALSKFNLRISTRKASASSRSVPSSLLKLP